MIRQSWDAKCAHRRAGAIGAFGFPQKAYGHQKLIFKHPSQGEAKSAGGYQWANGQGCKMRALAGWCHGSIFSPQKAYGGPISKHWASPARGAMAEWPTTQSIFLDRGKYFNQRFLCVVYLMFLTPKFACFVTEWMFLKKRVTNCKSTVYDLFESINLAVMYLNGQLTCNSIEWLVRYFSFYASCFCYPVFHFIRR